MASAFSFCLVSALLGVFAVSWASVYDPSYAPAYPTGSATYNSLSPFSRKRGGYPSSYPGYPASYSGYPVTTGEFRIPILSDIFDFFASLLSMLFGGTSSYPYQAYSK